MTLRKLASEIAKREGKKSEARIGDIREILKVVTEIEAEECFAGIPDGGPLHVLTEQANKKLAKLRKAKK